MIETKIGSGSFGDVYLAKDTRSGQHVAVKIEYNNNEFSQICNESRIYLKLRNQEGVPQFIKYGVETDSKYLATELLGPTLGNLHTICGSRFSL